MSIPDFQSLTLPVLEYAAEHPDGFSVSSAREELSTRLGLSDEDYNELLPSGVQTKFANRIGWVCVYFSKALVLDRIGRGKYKITKRGIDLLKSNPGEITTETLRQYPEFVEFQKLKGTRSAKSRQIANGEEKTEPETNGTGFETPNEAMEWAYEDLRSTLASELLEMLKNNSPAFFERTVVDLLVKMGYGGSRADAGRAIGRSGDEGIDGVINEDRLGLDVVYLQAKRYTDSSVGRPDVMKFAGALQGKRANKGIFITTSRFTEDALSYVGMINSKIVLIGGERLCELMIDHDIGVTTESVFAVKKVDSDYFEED
ncbi:MAG: restriction endonuclease [Planctomycetes bacterium]|nr:restriction endonuclease [Planctomycetota bacterium]